MASGHGGLIALPSVCPQSEVQKILVGLGQLPGTARVLTDSIASHCQPVDGLSLGTCCPGEGSVSQENSCQVSQADESISGHGELPVREVTRKDTSQVFADPCC